ncbi:MAG: hypothetical protein ABIY70_00845 [Capsulimonas sp.]|uniref:DUF4440 domain-containing protein n=1 Tax=Capsulimonas sp. TaxID=2494211 RepID=UPI0032662006
MNKLAPTLLLLACASALPAHAVTVAEARHGIHAALDKRTAARHQHNAAAYLSTFAPTWTLTDVSGATQTYATMRKTIIDRLAHLPVTQMYKMTWKITKVTATGREAHATIATHYAHPPRRTPNGPVYVTQDMVSDTVWERTPGGWVQRSEKYVYDAKAFSTRAGARGEW